MILFFQVISHTQQLRHLYQTKMPDPKDQPDVDHDNNEWDSISVPKATPDYIDDDYDY